ncbi:MAG: UvrD-helicase domain-containing protein [Rubritalea sp.]|uniref:UvrD-helicase domain-containing protein n=1 Tax=Rubritalea sp. TaxID=2109375 RepID=UPI00324254CE
MITQFNPVRSAIEHGLTLLEAGAGTGKTYSLVRIIVRELVEKELDPSEIVTVTFTRAATAEIKSRLHGLLSEILSDLKKPEDEMQNDIAKAWVTEGEEWVENAKHRLSIALSAFDSISIFTIDGFFQRLLKEYAFESNVLFSIELEPDDSPLIHTALQDYWRQYVYRLKGEALALFQQSVDFKKAKNFLNEALRSSEVTFDPAYSESADALNAEYAEAWHAFVAILKDHRGTLRDFIDNPTPGIKKNAGPFRKGGDVKLFAEVDDILANPKAVSSNTPLIDHLRASHVLSDAAFNKNKFVDLSGEPVAKVFHAVQALIDARPSNIRSAYFGEIYRFVEQRLKELKADLNTQSYNDVTITLSNLLVSDSKASQTIKAAIYKRYKAALIDEFQDTSPQQCNVFIQLFNQEKRAEEDERYFHIIGDPKQSIYRFRGADVFSYIAAVGKADHHYSLLTNYRSSPSMIHAVNKVFSISENPFLVEGGISFTRSQWPSQSGDTPDSAQPALWVQSIEMEKTTADQTRSLFYNDICRNILDLLDTPWREIDPQSDRSEPVQPSDFAVLVRSKKQGEALNILLSEHKVPSTLSTRTSLMASAESSETLTILSALLNPRSTPAIRSALLTPALGSGEQLASDASFDQVSNDFSELHTLWNEHGLMPMMQSFIARFSVRSRLLQLTHGQRRLTNFNHLAELLDTKAREEKLTPSATVQWLEMAIQGSIHDTDAEQLELRIATDDAAVQILTQHTSKGLEYPIVFVLPSCDNKISATRLSHTYHHPKTGDNLFAPYGNNAHESLEIRKGEEQADSVRLTYVALTRAKYRCYFYYDPPVKKSPLDHAIYRMLGELNQAEIEALCGESDNTIVYTPLDEETLNLELKDWTPQTSSDIQELSIRDSSKVHFVTQKRTTSFTGITHNAPDIFHDVDGTVVESIGLAEQGFWSKLQAGASLGLVFHEILEELDFQDTSALLDLVDSKLHKYSPWRERPTNAEITEIIQEIVLNIEKLLEHEIAPGMQLNQLSQKQRLNEAQFLLSGSNFSLSTLCDILESDPPAGLPDGYIEQLRKVPALAVEGFLDGIIDLVFEHGGRYHILDWKSNKLANSLPEMMADHHYFLQYHLYTLALDQLLQQRLGANYEPSTHLGSSIYVFLRGVDTAIPSSGIYSDALSPARLIALRNAFTKQPSLLS